MLHYSKHLRYTHEENNTKAKDAMWRGFFFKRQELAVTAVPILQKFEIIKL
jgi:hypothetical protein